MKIKTIHIISLVLLLVTSMNFAMDNFTNQAEWEISNLEQNESETESDDLDVDHKKNPSSHQLNFQHKNTLVTVSSFSYGYTVLEYFEKIPTPPPEA